ncbi:MAG: hypothetical protein AAF990_15330 [Bacteroidota bacterium]
MRTLSLLLILMVFLPSNAQAQKVLQMEKFGKAKVTKYFIGDELTFRLKGEKDYWYQEVIQDILADDGLILFTNRAVKVSDIDAIRSYRIARFTRPFSRNLYLFATSWTVFSLLAIPTLGWEIGLADGIIVGTSLLSGYLIRRLFRYRTYRMGKKRQLRLLNLDWNDRP